MTECNDREYRFSYLPGNTIEDRIVIALFEIGDPGLRLQMISGPYAKVRLL